MVSKKIASEDKEGRLWRSRETGRYDKFKIVKELLMVCKSPPYHSLDDMEERLVRPLNEESWRDLGIGFLEVVPNISLVNL